MYTPATGIMFNSPDGVSGQPSTSIVFTNPDAFLLSGPGGNTDGSGLAISNAAGAIFTLMVNSTTNGLTFTPR
jgi:hypothetical protein